MSISAFDEGRGFGPVIKEANDLKLTIDQKKILYGNTLLFLFGGMPHQTLTLNLCKAGINFDVKNFRIAVQSNGRLMKHGKAWVYSRYCGEELYDHDLSRKELNAFHLAMSFKPLLARLKELRTMGRPALSLSSIDAQMVLALEARDVVAHAKSVIYKKLSFLIHYGKRPDDLYGDLVTAALLAMMRVYPQWENPDHLKRASKTAMRNRALNIIEEQVTLKRQSMYTDEKGKSHVLKASFDEMTEEGGTAFVSNSFLSVGITGDHRNYDQLHSLRQVIVHRDLSPKQKRYLKLLMGEFDEGFSEKLGGNNSDIFDMPNFNFSLYKSKVEAYLGIPKSAADSFLKGLKPLL